MGANCTVCCSDNDHEGGESSKMAKVKSLSAWAEEVEPVQPKVGGGGEEQSREVGSGAGGNLHAVQPCADPNWLQAEIQTNEYRTTIERNGSETIGINLDVTDCVSLVVVDILPGAIYTWNESHAGERNLKVNDRIVEANGCRGDADKLLCVLKQSTTWSLVVQRPVEFRAVINRSGSISLGMDLRYAPNGSTLMISEVEDGPIKDWNAVSATWKIKKFDRIIELNGIRGSSQELLHAGMEEETLEMCILHYDLSDAASD